MLQPLKLVIEVLVLGGLARTEVDGPSGIDDTSVPIGRGRRPQDNSGTSCGLSLADVSSEGDLG